jgi:hypothetical protein
MEVVETMKNAVVRHGVATTIFDDCYHIACEFIKISFDHVPMDANMAAHELAKLARSDNPSVWMDQPPDSIRKILLDDVTVISNEYSVSKVSKKVVACSNSSHMARV